MSMDQGPASPRPQSNRSRGFSFHSTNSGSKKESYAESPEEKKRRDQLWQGGSKANPNAALAEAQPGGMSHVLLHLSRPCLASLSVHRC